MNSTHTSLWIGLLAGIASVSTLYAIYLNLYKPTAKTIKKEKKLDACVVDMLRREQLSRNYIALGEEKMESLARSLVIIVGVGGVGAHAAHMLARSGIGALKLIDFDNITLSSLNRAPLARRADVGMTKVDHLAAALKEIAPWVNIEANVEVFEKTDAGRLLSPSPTHLSVMVLDCIDNIETKVDLIEYCFKNKIPFLSSGGAGCKLDPTKLSISDISKTTDDPLARSVRQRLRKRGIKQGVEMLFSTERSNGLSLQAPQNEDRPEATDADSFAVLPSFRSGVVPVIGPMPALFGMAMAMHTICTLAGASKKA